MKFEKLIKIQKMPLKVDLMVEFCKQVSNMEVEINVELLCNTNNEYK